MKTEFKAEPIVNVDPLCIYDKDNNEIIKVKHDGRIEVRGVEISTDQEYRDMIMAVCLKLVEVNYKSDEEKARLEEIFNTLVNP